MRILYVTARYPELQNKGDQLIAYEQIKRLSQRHEIHLFSLSPPDEGAGELEMQKYCRSVHVAETAGLRPWGRILKTLCNGKPFQVNMYYSRRHASELKRLSERINPDLAHFQTVRSAVYERAAGNVPKVLDMVDLMSLNMSRRGARERFYLKWLFHLEGKLLKRYEKYIYGAFERVVLVSEADAMASDLPSIAVNSNGTVFAETPEGRHLSMTRENTAVFHGNLSYFPNSEAALYLAENIWPEIKKKHPELSLQIIGRNPQQRLRRLNGKNGIEITGYVADVASYLRKAKLGIYIMHSGTGMQNKILEALACGVPIVASDRALQGFSDLTEREVLVSRSEAEIFTNVDRILAEDGFGNSLGTAGSDRVRDFYTWRHNVDRLEMIWFEACAGCGKEGKP